MNGTWLRRSAAVMLASTGAIHLVLIGHEAGESGVVAALFVVGGLASCALALVLWEVDEPAPWALGALACAAMVVGLVMSRTVGLLGLREAKWEPAALLSLAIEVSYLIAWIPTLAKGRVQARHA